MGQILSSQLFSWAVYAVSLFALCLITIGRGGIFGRLCIQGVIGSSVIFILNCVLSEFSLCLGINALTVGVSAVLGMPGIGLMYLMLYIL